jgi:AraC-like DNA-binding protein
MEPAPSFEAMLKMPLGRYAAEGSTVYWCVDAQLTGCAIWGRPGRADIERLLSLFDRGGHEHISRECDFVLDVRAVEGIDPMEFAGFEQSWLERLQHLPSRVRKQALLRPSGMIGAIVEGFYGMIGASVTWSSFGELAAALEWIGRPGPLALASQIDEIVQAVMHGGPLAARLRAWLGDNGFRAKVGDAAAALGVSSRTLQRSLSLSGRSFRGELDGARLAAAEAQLLDSHAPLAEIAEKLGFRSASHFSTWFRKLTGTAPRDFQKRANEFPERAK